LRLLPPEPFDLAMKSPPLPGLKKSRVAVVFCTPRPILPN
jgi:hypothetical protein